MLKIFEIFSNHCVVSVADFFPLLTTRRTTRLTDSLSFIDKPGISEEEYHAWRAHTGAIMHKRWAFHTKELVQDALAKLLWRFCAAKDYNAIAPILDDIIGQAGEIADIFNRSRCDYGVGSFMSHVQRFHGETMEEVGKPEQEQLHNLPAGEWGKKRKYSDEGMVISPFLRRLGGFNGLGYECITVVAKASFYCFEPNPLEQETPFVKRRRVARTFDES
jgi:hypothetical protein